MNGPLIPDIDPTRVDVNGVAELLKSLEVHKAAGPDEIPAHPLKETSELLAPSLTLIYQGALLTEKRSTGAPYLLYPFLRRVIMLL